jgi:AAA15 family ATPase/GTPase
LTPEEDRVIQALRIIEPDIERLAVVGGRTSVSRARGGVVLRMRGIDQPVPIGSLGDGMWRMLAIAIALIRSENGVFLVDEIDTGLHYTVMEDMWRMIAAIARQLNIQVFATTHSSDCVNSLASIATKDSDGNTEASLQRIERNNDHSIRFTEREIAIAAERGIEVR